MKKDIDEVIGSLDDNELYSLREDLSKGGIIISKLVSERIRQIEKEKSGVCVTCGNDLKEHPRSFNLVFGPEDFRKKAGFCELDCLEYFIAHLKEQKEGKNELQARD